MLCLPRVESGTNANWIYEKPTSLMEGMAEEFCSMGVRPLWRTALLIAFGGNSDDARVSIPPPRVRRPPPATYMLSSADG